MTRAKSKPLRGQSQVPKRGYGFLAAVLDEIDAQPLIDALTPPVATGRPGFSPRAMLRAFLSKYLLNIRFNVDLIRRLGASQTLRQICGFGETVPSESTFSRFASKLRDQQALVEDCFDAVTRELRDILPNFGRTVAVDSTMFPAFSNPNRKVISDPDATWGLKNSSRAKDGKKEYMFGYKLHLLSDADYGLPLTFTLTPANRSDLPLLRDLLRKADETLPWLKPRHLLADRGYDSEDCHIDAITRGIIPVIHIRKPSGASGLHRGIYSAMGSPTCVGKVSMKYIRTDTKLARHLFRCPSEGCDLKAKSNGGLRYCDSEVWEDPVENLRIVGLLPRESPEWKRQYAKRMSIERIFRSLKHSRLLDGHQYRGLAKIRMHATLSLLTYQATALARARAGDLANLRQMRI